MKEHPGGSPRYGLDDDWNEKANPVKIENPAFTIDSFRDELRDRVKAGEDIEPWIADIIHSAIVRATTETIRQVVSFLADCRTPRLKLHQLLWACGYNSMMHGYTASQLASRNGVTKQAFQQGAEAIRQQFRLPVTEAMRDEAARDEMSQRNHRSKTR